MVKPPDLKKSGLEGDSTKQPYFMGLESVAL
jgi:hypothetical protein